ncbi:MAG: MFS transporter permease [Antricoccus sp.]
MTERGPLLRWFLSPVPLHRVALMRVVAYLFILIDVFLTTTYVAAKATAPSEFYRPLAISQLLHLPVPTYGYVTTLQWILVVAALIAATGWQPRWTGSIVAICYLLWMIIGMSYGKVDHDRYAYLILLFVLPTIGPAKLGDRRLSERAGWAFQMVFLAIMLTYFLSSVAKLRFGGIDWPTGATITRAVVRRGTFFSHWMLSVPYMLVIVQFVMMACELLSPLMLLCRSAKARMLLVTGLLLFHIGTYATLTIIFLPHCIAILSLLPWGDVRCTWAQMRGHRARGGAAGQPVTVSGDPSIDDRGDGTDDRQRDQQTENAP